MAILSGQIASIVSGKLIGPDNLPITNYFIDSRKVTIISGESLFIAMGGLRTDGHHFIPALYDLGVRAFLVNEKSNIKALRDMYPEAAFIITVNTLDAFQILAAYIRSKFNGTVIAITGSNGKTIVKEWFSDILGKEFGVLRSPRSYNSQTGVPLSVINLNNNYEFGVFEAGMSYPGEIRKLENIIRPDIAVFTNIGDAHQENFENINEKVKEKLELFKNCHTMVYSVDHKEIRKQVTGNKDFSEVKMFTWSFNNSDANVRFEILNRPGDDTVLKVKCDGREFLVKLLYSDYASVQNVAIVITLLLLTGVEKEQIIENIELIKPVEMRMEQKEGTNGCTLIEDYYNSDPASLSIALDYLKDMPGNFRRVIISDFVQQNKTGRSIYADVAQMIKKAGIDNTICIGEEISRAKDYFQEGSIFFRTTEAFVKWYSVGKFTNELILLKGARKFEFERISTLLELKAHITTLEINLNNLLNNLNQYRSLLSAGTRTMAMVKAFAYGGGPKQISEWLANKGIDYLAVAYIDEGQELREANISARIMVMNPDMSSSRLLLDYNLEPEIFSSDMLKQFISVLEKEGLENYPIHVKIDTGMHRLGFVKNQIDELLDILRANKRVRVASVFSHLSASEESSYDDETRKQANIFIEACERIENVLGYKVIRHLLNSAGIIRFPEYHFDMVRMGIGLFGVGLGEVKGVKNVISFKSSVSQVKLVCAGEGIGYGFTDISESDRHIATIPIGYADGLNRRLGNGIGRVYIKSTYVPIVGRICMDMCMVDVTGLSVNQGDRVEIFGEKISVFEIAEKCDTIPYEILTSIPPRVKRVYHYE